MRRMIATVAALAALTISATAAPDETAHAHFIAGNFAAAAETAEVVGGAENLALAARALNAAAYFETDDKSARRLAKRARNYAEDAMEKDQRLVEGHLQYAIAIAQRASRMSPLRAFFAGSAGKARDALDFALSLEPENPWALSSSAAWHLEVARRAGDGRFGSDAAFGHAQFTAARRLDPDNISIAYEAALRLLAFGNDDWRELALESLDAAVTIEPQSSMERGLAARAKALKDAVQKGVGAEATFIETWGVASFKIYSGECWTRGPRAARPSAMPEHSDRQFVYRLTTRDEWFAAKETGVVPTREIDKRDGYIHLSTRAQVLETAALHFAGADDLLALEIDAAMLGDALKYELAPKRGEEFPHYYGALRLRHVIRAIALTRTGDAFEFGEAV